MGTKDETMIAQGLITEITFQHRPQGYEHGFTINLGKEVAENVIAFLKSAKHWYSTSDPKGGVEILRYHAAYINKYILNAV